MKDKTEIYKLAKDQAKQWYEDLLNDGSDNSTYLQDAYEIGYTNGYTTRDNGAEEEAIRFAQWTAIEGWHYHPIYEDWYKMHLVGSTMKSKDLLTLYREQKGKEGK